MYYSLFLKIPFDILGTHNTARLKWFIKKILVRFIKLSVVVSINAYG